MHVRSRATSRATSVATARAPSRTTPRTTAFALVVLLVALALAGCSGKGATSSSPSSSARPSGVTNPSASASIGTPAPSSSASNGGSSSRQPVKIHETGDLTPNGVDRAFNWTVARGYEKFTFHFELYGPQQLPEYGASNLNYRLVNGAGKTENEASSGGGSGVTVSPSGCVVCNDYRAGQAPAGPWLFSVAAGPSAATYVVDIIVDY